MRKPIAVAAAAVLSILAGGPAGEAHRPGAVTAAPPLPEPTGDLSVTYHRDVAPILQRSCQECHRPGEVAPMSLLTYADARRSASRIQEVLSLGTMPPWFADAGVNRFANDRRLSDADVRTLTSWIDAGGPEGDPADAPAPRKFEDGWTIKPDLVAEMARPFEVPAAGTLEYQYVVIPLDLAEARWAQAIEIRPGDRSVVHHVRAMLRMPGNPWLTDVPIGDTRPKRGPNAAGGMRLASIASYSPGRGAVVYPPGRATLIPKGSDLVLELHYTTNGTARKDRTRVGIVFAKEPPAEQVRRFAIANRTFTIPPGEADHRVEAAGTLTTDAKLIALFPHMHLRGKSAELRMVTPEGERKTLLRVSGYDAMWQIRYELAEERVLKKGTRLEATFTFDNSRRNPANPDATATVRWGDQTWDEMALGAFEVVVPRGSGLRELIARDPR